MSSDTSPIIIEPGIAGGNRDYIRGRGLYYQRVTATANQCSRRDEDIAWQHSGFSDWMRSSSHKRECSLSRSQIWHAAQRWDVTLPTLLSKQCQQKLELFLDWLVEVLYDASIDVDVGVRRRGDLSRSSKPESFGFSRWYSHNANYKVSSSSECQQSCWNEATDTQRQLWRWRLRGITNWNSAKTIDYVELLHFVSSTTSEVNKQAGCLCPNLKSISYSSWHSRSRKLMAGFGMIGYIAHFDIDWPFKRLFKNLRWVCENYCELISHPHWSEWVMRDCYFGVANTNSFMVFKHKIELLYMTNLIYLQIMVPKSPFHRWASHSTPQRSADGRPDFGDLWSDWKLNATDDE